MKSKANGTEIKQNLNLQNQSYTNLYLKNAIEEQGFESWPPSICGFEFRGNSCTRQKKGIETNVSVRSPRPVLVRLGSNLSSPPILLRLLLSSGTLLASLRSLATRSMYAQGVTVNQGWREADDYPTEARVSTDVSEGGSQAVMNLRKNKFWRTGPLARLNRNEEQAGKP